MKHLQTYIIEALITEGGHSVEGATPIRGDLAAKVAGEIIAKLKEEFGDIPMSALGSTGKKRADQTSGDIDIAVQFDWKDHIKVKNFIEKTFNPVPGKMAESLHLFNIGYRYDDNGEEKIVQVDFMFVEDVDFAKFCFHSPSFIPDEMGKVQSAFKGAFRTQLMIATVDSLDAEQVLGKEYAPTYFTKDDYDGQYAGELKTKWRVMFNKVDGMKVKKVSYEGKTKPVKSPKTVEAKSYTKNIDDMIHTCFGKDADRDTMNSYESIIDYIFSSKFKYRSKELLQNIEKWLFPQGAVSKGPLEGEKEDMIKLAMDYFDNKLKEYK